MQKPSRKGSDHGAEDRQVAQTVRLRKIALLSLAAVAMLVAPIVAWVALLRWQGNFHPIIAGEYYRSAQLDGPELRARIHQNRIRSIINLRGAHPGDPWYDAEIAAARAEGISHFDFKMLASEHLSPARAAAVLDVLRNAPKPVLVHCQGGSDRTGLVSSLYLTALAGRGEAEAERQLSVRYGHFSVPVLSSAWPMDESWEALEPWLGFTDS